MKTKFFSTNGCPIVFATVTGPRGALHLNMLVDTGASYSSLNSVVLAEIGVEIAATQAVIVSATSVAQVNTAYVNRLAALGVEDENMRIVVLDFPEGTVRIDGILGVDFFSNKKLAIDFKKHTIEVKA